MKFLPAGILVCCTLNAPALASTYSASLQTPVSLVTANTAYTILSVIVPKGNWIVSATAVILDKTGLTVTPFVPCNIFQDSNAVETTAVGGQLSNRTEVEESLPVLATITAQGSSTIALKCSWNGTGTLNALEVESGALVVTSAGKLH